MFNKNHDLEKQHAYNKREHKRSLVEARDFIEHNKRNQINNLTYYLQGYCDTMDKSKVAIKPKSRHILEREMKQLAH